MNKTFFVPYHEEFPAIATSMAKALGLTGFWQELFKEWLVINNFLVLSEAVMLSTNHVLLIKSGDKKIRQMFLKNEANK